MKALAALTIAAIIGTSSCAQAALVAFDLLGKAGAGLLPGNEFTAPTGIPGTGGERGAGIIFNDVSLVLSIDIGWGTGNGFTDLSSTISGGHIHGPTTSGGSASFNQEASVAFTLNTLPGWNNSRTAGGFTGNVTLNSTQATQLMAGRFYINVHTNTNGGGEIRGNLVAIPEPSSLALVVAGAGLLARRRNRAERLSA